MEPYYDYPNKEKGLKMSFYKCEHFEIFEIVPPELMSLPEEYLWELFDENLLIVIDRLREILGKPMTVNNWKSGGQFKWRGYRTNSCKIGANKSPHRIGRGIDFDVKGMTAKEVRDFIMKRQDQFPEIGRMEDDVTWVHIDTIRKKNHKGIYLFKP